MKARKVITGAVLLLATAAAAIAVLRPAIWRAPATIEERAEKALRYAGRKGLNVNYCLLLDYGIESGKPRLFVWSFKERRVVYSAHAMHGPGKGSTAVTPVFSNTPGSKCSSVGRFEVTRDRGRRNRSGLRLRGLERSNSKAYGRGIMIHGSKWVDVNKWRRYIPLNEKSCQGCVTVSTRDMAYINRLVGKEEGNLLLWSYYDAVSKKKSGRWLGIRARVQNKYEFSKYAFQGPGRPIETFFGEKRIYLHRIQSATGNPTPYPTVLSNGGLCFLRPQLHIP